MNKTVKREGIYFNGFLRYSKKKKIAKNDNEYCGLQTQLNNLSSHKNITNSHDIPNEKENIQNKENDVKEQYEAEEKKECNFIDNDIKGLIDEKDIVDIQLKKKITSNFGKKDKYNIENGINFPKSDYVNSLNRKNKYKIQNGLSGLKKKKINKNKLDNALKEKNITFSKKVEITQKKKKLLHKNKNYPKSLNKIDKRYVVENYIKNFLNKKQRNNVKPETYKYKYELPTIASLGKAKTLSYFNYAFKEDILNDTAKLILNNLSNIYFENSVLRFINLRKKKKLTKKKKN
ncbi:conserved Plasmodium protein, unknown function [Plasmodium berghei]|uniref:Uncharacterized protein n=2 Tax=Plasmodium berghei TaxID=5821 RepID=A0A509ASM3_PLABA|nr:conserved Plasmodium protein, unknown function [Plasmodium berghei ANKA]CXJ16834.1 conserved Plasmodium protein, unknown function [Plasmodium berghei]SCM26338.1 conserved Plasmodium protein, unknown function [Plasmodium berghei]SCN28402.1 conserved Plasmodium protein, unknown function [Plasmodium berghei]SCO62596.1 conserved Plasmodium protein, unknown function [Plasmodium berghei]SCO64154.1 conserved Plasmodium protein, unknown function [Plasmodium berghei]|eukprot:XP_034424050.1 conserved Plasmodium protein, unknown function [Plasmodium berghei ANKA]